MVYLKIDAANEKRQKGLSERLKNHTFSMSFEVLFNGLLAVPAVPFFG